VTDGVTDGVIDGVRGRGDQPEVAVVVVNWNAGPALHRMLASLEQNPPTGPWEAVLVDNASSDGSTEGAALAFPWLRILANDTNRGLAAANNQGITVTTAPTILLANPDIELPPRGVDGLLRALQRHPRACFIVPRLAHPDGAPQTSAGDLPTLFQALGGRRRGRGFWWHHWDHGQERVIGRGAEACYLVRRSAVEEFGLQDEAYRLDWEGIDWTDRARRAGWEVWLEPSVTVTHVGGVSISGAWRRWVVQSHVGMYRYFAARRPALWRPLLGLIITGRAVLKLAAGTAGVPLYRRAQGR
jgi:N-acetylglucosaminyl-diphospho-decaprenol L-rhamnosyltransferase